MTRRDDSREIRAMLQDRLGEVLGRLLPGGRVDGGLYKAKNPTRDDRNAGSFVVWMHGVAKGGFKDYAGGEADKGDIIDLINYVHRRPKSDRKFAFQWARDFLGLAAMDPRAREAAAAAAKAKALQQERSDKANELAKQLRAVNMFEKAQPIIGSPAERYFEAREIPLSMIANLSGDLRFVPSLEWWRGAEWDMRDQKRVKVRPGPTYPAIISAVRKADGSICAVHCTFLDHGCGAKAPVEDPKLMFGAVAGGVIRLTNGPSGQSPEEAAVSGRRDILVISEGIETGLSVAIVAPEARCWAATSVSNFANVPVWHACVLSVVIAADNPSEGKRPEARAQFFEQMERAVEALSQHGIPVTEMTAHGGANDFNDLIRD
ncbi:toprim domain-containing protein [Tardiphaga sp.]|jgi:hypothetical protein|uniref:DUF7146 domain-containing protein n=1 Tax=Tardiphaga sp. TaxID=1926292 RepID=UPI0037DA5C2F